ncbi:MULTISPECIES: hypothetical protein [unclassified Actinotalea]|uniref:hypothetical protein n=1 Tax=unclassified Actinotalea TaxID=2638618 RepID=UPI0015F75E6C|nr:MULTISPECIES: hypothetical protein [unclassified Actinotalea]
MFRRVAAVLAVLLPALVLIAPSPSQAAGDVITGVVYDTHRVPLNGIRVELVTVDEEGTVTGVLASATTAGDSSTPGGPGFFTLQHSRTVPWRATVRAVDPSGELITTYDSNSRTHPFWGEWVDAAPEPTTYRIPEAVILTMGAPGRYLPLDPRRVYDSRTDDDRRPLRRGEFLTVELPYTPGDVVAAAVNITTTQTSCATTYIAQASHVVGYPWGADSSIVNARAGADVANHTVLATSRNEEINRMVLYNHLCETHMVVDLVGVYAQDAPGFAGYQPATPERVLDTRVDVGALGPREALEVPITALATDAPADAVAVAVNVTATAGTAPTSYLSVYEAGDPYGWETSTLNAYRGADVANLAVVPLSDDGAIEVYNNSGNQHVVLDVQGWYTQTDGLSFWPMDHRRTASSEGPALGPGATRVTTDPGRGIEAPAGAQAVLLNLTSTRATSPTTFVTAHPSGQARPFTSNVNARRGIDLANSAVVGLGVDGGWALYNNAGSVRLLEDVAGWFAPSKDD